MIPIKHMPSLARLTEVFELDRDRGLLIWKRRKLEDFSSERSCNSWNVKCAGKQAGWIGNGYFDVQLDGSTLKVHRVIWSLANHQAVRDTQEIDHIDGDSLNNRPDNLRVATRQQNCMNSKSYNVSGIKGVYASGKRYLSAICVNRKRIYLGMFKTAEEAHAAYCAASLKHHGEFGRTA